MDPKFSRLNDRLKIIIEESNKVLGTAGKSEYGTWIQDTVLLNSWAIRSRNIIILIFGENSSQYKELEIQLRNDLSEVSTVQAISGLLIGAQDDFENGFIIGQEFIIAGEIFDSVLEEAKHLLETNHKDASAVLGRVVIEDSLKRIARREGIDDALKASRINDELKKIGLYSQPQWRLIQSWLDIGNAAAHGDFAEYDGFDVKNMLVGLEQFFATYF